MEFKRSSDQDKFWRDDAHKLLTQWEDMRQYPPHLSLVIVRTQDAWEPLRTDVTVNGVEPELKILMIAPPYSGIKNIILYTSYICFVEGIIQSLTKGSSNCGSRQANPTQVVTEMTEIHASKNLKFFDQSVTIGIMFQVLRKREDFSPMLS